MKRALTLSIYIIVMVLISACLVLIGLTQSKVRIGIAPYARQEIPRIAHIEPEPMTQDEIDHSMSFDNEDALSVERGALYYNDHKETYYSQNVLPGEMLEIPGRHVAFDGTIRDEDGYICVAADYSYLEYGEVVETSLGWGKVYDTGCAYGTVDIYVDW